ncbi:unnamed protein product [Callosobruchus maculatus]|uniref:Uncharacterized protein n=1 Tax=Callosobruchus maculatus TaxID=64391 RepID=A0A653DJG4_CALMS|nr:unnamed protein product [Callosobruchus maculatus]
MESKKKVFCNFIMESKKRATNFTAKEEARGRINRICEKI